MHDNQRAWDENPPASYQPPTETERLRAEIERLREALEELDHEENEARAQASADASRLREALEELDQMHDGCAWVTWETIDALTKRAEIAEAEVRQLRRALGNG